MVDRSGKNVDLFLDVRVLPGHERLKLVNKVVCYEAIFPHRIRSFSGIIFEEKCQKLFQIILTVLVIEVEGECNGSDGKNL